MATHIEHGTGLLKGPYVYKDHILKIWFEPRLDEGVIICHRRHEDGERVSSITYDIDSTHPSTGTFSPEERASWEAAREIMGWKEQRR